MDISDDIFFLVLAEKQNVPATLRPGYDPATGDFDRESGEIVAQDKVAQVRLAKEIVQELPKQQDSETLGKYCDYFLRLLWLRENWLLSKKSMVRSVGTGQRWSVKGYVDIHKDDTAGLLGQAAYFFCGITVDPDFAVRVLSLAKKYKYIHCSCPTWSNGPQTFYFLSPTGKLVAELSDKRLLCLIDNDCLPLENNAHDDDVTQQRTNNLEVAMLIPLPNSKAGNIDWLNIVDTQSLTSQNSGPLCTSRSRGSETKTKGNVKYGIGTDGTTLGYIWCSIEGFRGDKKPVVFYLKSSLQLNNTVTSK